MQRILAGRPGLVDAVVAAVLVVAGLVETTTAPTVRPLWIHVPLMLVIMGSIAFRRRAPLLVIAVVVLGTLAIDPNGELAIFVALLLVSYTCGAQLDPPRAYVGLALAVGPMWTFFLLFDGEASDFVAIAVFYGGSWVVGRILRDRTRRAVEQAARADRAEQSREEQARQAVVEERTRIARELHDVVAHSISVITVQTQAVRRRLDPQLTREIADLQAVETTARQAMAEMRRLFGVLRADTEKPALEPQPGLDQLDRLVADTRAADVPVDVVVEGESVPLPPGLDLAAFRIVQEALTNVRKHAPGARVEVTLRYAERGLELTVRDHGGRRTVADGGGHGLVGMRERVALYGGSLQARPTGNGFVVQAVLPMREGAAA
ncbi:MAG: histidine kinase [Actinomycetota bacterium]|nr:histidine kinase [Actinomycetota bacterium]